VVVPAHPVVVCGAAGGPVHPSVACVVALRADPVAKLMRHAQHLHDPSQGNSGPGGPLGGAR
jgi:hypothetical protein